MGRGFDDCDRVLGKEGDARRIIRMSNGTGAGSSGEIGRSKLPEYHTVKRSKDGVERAVPEVEFYAIADLGRRGGGRGPMASIEADAERRRQKLECVTI